MALLTVYPVTEDGIDSDANFVAADAGAGGDDTFPNTGDVIIHVKNAHASAARAVTVAATTISVEKEGFGTLTKGNAGGSVPALDERMFGPFPVAAFGKTATVTYDDESDLTIKAIRVQKK